MKFLKYLTPSQINELCKQGKVKIEITATIKDGEIITHLPTGGTLTETHEQIIFQTSTVIRSWADLFEIDRDKSASALRLSDKEREDLR